MTSICCDPRHLSHLEQLEAESIAIIREVAAEFKRPMMLFSIGKDSCVMLRLAEKAFFPAKIPFPLLHIDTTWKFRAMLELRDRLAASPNYEILVWRNEQGLAEKVNPFDWGVQEYTFIMKTTALKQALEYYGVDAALGGARRDEEKSRAKERVYSFRDRYHQWDPKNQRPELWGLYNGRIHAGESMRVFPLSNWTETDVWTYIYLENIEVVPLYFAESRPMVRRADSWIMVDDERMRLLPGEVAQWRQVRFRTLGCYPLSGAIDSTACTALEVLGEMFATRHSERQGRLIDFAEAGSMEEKKREGYF